MNKQIIGFTCGTFDLFHIGHVNLLRNAKALCDKLVVGVISDELLQEKNKNRIIPYDERAEIVRSIKYVDCVIPQSSHNKLDAYNKLKYDILFVDDDWYLNDDWKFWESKLKEFHVKVIYFPYTKTTSTYKIINKVVVNTQLHK